jgi:hypothetical protein
MNLATVTLSSTLATLCNAATVTVAWESTRTPSTQRDGNCRIATAKAVALAMLATPEGREALDALTAGPEALRPIHDEVLYAGGLLQWKDQAGNREWLSKHLATPTAVCWPPATPMVAKAARLALASYAKAEAAKAKAEAKAEATPATAPTVEATPTTPTTPTAPATPATPEAAPAPEAATVEATPAPAPEAKAKATRKPRKARATVAP